MTMQKYLKMEANLRSLDATADFEAEIAEYGPMSKAAIRDAVEGVGKWNEFVLAREKHKKAGLPVLEAYRAAYAEVLL